MSQFEFAPPPVVYLYQQPERLSHSTCGLLSFTLAFLSAVVFCTLLGVITYVVATAPDPESLNPENWDRTTPPLVFLIAGFGIWGCIFTTFAAFILGLVSIFQPHTRKIFPLLGLIFSGLPLLLLAAFIITGIIAMILG